MSFYKIRKNILCTMGLMMLQVVGCGRAPQDSFSKETTIKTVPPSKLTIKKEVRRDDVGKYSVKLEKVNESFDLNVQGTFQINIEKDLFLVDGYVSGVDSGIKHYQIIQSGGECPTMDSDLNFDGIIDNLEGSLVYGTKLIPLDANISAQFEGMSYGPIANEEGEYFYRKSVPFSSLMADLKSLDDDLYDDLIKIDFDQYLELEKRVIVIYGISSSVPLPSTVRGTFERDEFELIPIACGKIQRIDE